MLTLTSILKQAVFFCLVTLGSCFTSCDGQNSYRFGQGSAFEDSVNTVKGSSVSEIGRNIRCIFEDRNGNIWFGTDDAGLYRYDGEHIVLFNVTDGLSNNQIQTIQEDASGNIWFGTGNGVSSFDGRAFSTYKQTN